MGDPAQGALFETSEIEWIRPARYVLDPDTGIHAINPTDLADAAFVPTSEEAAYFYAEWEKILQRN